MRARGVRATWASNGVPPSLTLLCRKAYVHAAQAGQKAGMVRLLTCVCIYVYPVTGGFSVTAADTCGPGGWHVPFGGIGPGVAKLGAAPTAPPC